MDKIKLLYVGDHGKTGFGTVANGFLNGLHKLDKYEIIHLAINYNDLVPESTPWKMVPAGFYHPNGEGMYEASDPYGFLKMNTYVESFDPDVVFLNNDFPVVSRYLGPVGEPSRLAQHRSKKIIYSPLDSIPFPPVFSKVVEMFDQTIAYSYWQHQQMLSVMPDLLQMPVIYHGIDTDVYYPIDKKEAKKELHEVFAKYNKGANIPNFEDIYIVYFVGTNQWRKDIPALFRGYTAFRSQFKEPIFLIPHTNATPMNPGAGGWSLYNLRDLTGMKDAVLMQNANIFTPEEMNIFYNAADVLAYPTRGEGFGLPSIEAMATKTPVIATRFGPQFELHSEGRGYFIDVEDYEPGNVSAFTYFAKPSWRSLAQQLTYVYTHREEAAEVAERAYKWAIRHTWDSKAQQLDKVITECLQSPSNSRSQLQSSPKRRKKRS